MTAPPELPAGFVHDRTTAEFDQRSVPKGLLRAHKVARGVWGRLVVRSGTMTFVYEDEAEKPLRLGAGDSVPIEPGRPHHVEVPDPVRFVVEFWTPPES